MYTDSFSIFVYSLDSFRTPSAQRYSAKLPLHKSLPAGTDCRLPDQRLPITDYLRSSTKHDTLGKSIEVIFSSATFGHPVAYQRILLLIYDWIRPFDS